ncbi:MAG: vWA domain-containing protein [Bacillota bacterium]
MTNRLSLTARTERAHIPPSGGALHLLLQIGAESVAAGERLPLNLAAVADRSGSMHGPKLTYTKEALRFLVDQMGPADFLSVITYDDQVETLAPSHQVVHKDALKAAIRRIESGGTTNLSGGLATGMQQITAHARPRQVNRVLLMTDGLANVGVTDPETLIGWARAWRSRGLTLSTLGVGDDFAEDLLVALAEAGGGNFHYIADPDKIPAIFARELDGLLQVAAQGLQLQFEAEPGVAIDGVLGYPPAGTPQAITLDLPDIYGGEVKSVILALTVAAPPADGRLGRATLRFMDAAGPEPQSVTLEVSIGVTAEPGLLEAPPDPEVARQVGLARAGQAREEAVLLSDQGDLEAGARALEFAAAALAPMAAHDAEAAEQYAALQSQAEALRSAQYDKGMRKQMRQDSFQARQGRSRR